LNVQTGHEGIDHKYNKGEFSNMNYLPAQIEDVDTAGGFICGMKLWVEDIDFITLEFAVRFLDILDG